MRPEPAEILQPYFRRTTLLWCTCATLLLGEACRTANFHGSLITNPLWLSKPCGEVAT